MFGRYLSGPTLTWAEKKKKERTSERKKIKTKEGKVEEGDRHGDTHSNRHKQDQTVSQDIDSFIVARNTLTLGGFSALRHRRLHSLLVLVCFNSLANKLFGLGSQC